MKTVLLSTLPVLLCGLTPFAVAQGPLAPGAHTAPANPLHNQLQDAKPLVLGRPTEELPPGTIKVRVEDRNRAPIPNRFVRIGVMNQNPGAGAPARSQHTADTDAQGIATFEGLPTGTTQAYRITVPHGVATLGSMPFRLPTDRGYAASARVLPLTSDMSKVFQLMHRTRISLVEGRMRLTQQVQWVNLSNELFVFPEAGTFAALPKEATAFQPQASMTDQRVNYQPAESAKPGGVRLRGSLPPGRTNMVWSFDVPIEVPAFSLGTGALDLEIPVTFNTFLGRVEVQELAGLGVTVDGMPNPERHPTAGGPVWVTEAPRKGKVDSTAPIVIHLTGIPGPGPWRWLALFAAIPIAAFGVAVGKRKANAPSKADPTPTSPTPEVADLVAQYHQLTALHAAGEIGPQYLTTEQHRLRTQIAESIRSQGEVSEL